MPDGLLLLAFALTLVANAVLIVIAIRAMQPGGALSDGPRRPSREPWTAERNAARALEGDPPAPAIPTRSEPVTEAAASATAIQPGVGEPATAPSATAGTTSPRARKSTPRRPRAAATSEEKASGDAVAKSTGRTRKAAAPAGNGRRRRFSLPPLDDDSEKVSRSIESFLSSGEAAADSVAREPGADADLPPTTVALVAVTDASATAPSGNGHEPLPAGANGPPPATAEPPHEPATQDAFAAVERSLRSAARGTDRVDVQDVGRFRVVLAAAGELAARAYLRRVRATVEPLLEELDPPRRLAVATATVLDDPLDRADELAKRRLATAIEADDRDYRSHDENRLEKPRASGD